MRKLGSEIIDRMRRLKDLGRSNRRIQAELGGFSLSTISKYTRRPHPISTFETYPSYGKDRVSRAVVDANPAQAGREHRSALSFFQRFRQHFEEATEAKIIGSFLGLDPQVLLARFGSYPLTHVGKVAENAEDPLDHANRNMERLEKVWKLNAGIVERENAPSENLSAERFSKLLDEKLRTLSLKMEIQKLRDRLVNPILD